jgi:hypothetical protein
VACTLTADGKAAQAARWHDLFRRAGLDRTETPAGIRIRFRPLDRVERELRALVDVERECCRWARWEVETDADGAVALVVGSDAAGASVLHQMFPGFGAWRSRCECDDC